MLADAYGLEYVSGLIMSNLQKGQTFKILGQLYTVKLHNQRQLRLQSEKGKNYTAYRCLSGYVQGGSRKQNNGYNNLMRDVEGEIIVDLLNVKNPFHTVSDVFRLAEEGLKTLTHGQVLSLQSRFIGLQQGRRWET